ncbi:MAG TPA: hypothetical protein VF384_08985 [Planctomycetota bacterium]
MPSSCRSLAAVAVLTAALAAAPQASGDVVRQPSFVRVMTIDGEPLANAVVTFVGSIPHFGAATGQRDVLHVASDPRGRAMARLQAGLCYVAWAVGPPDAQGNGVLSAVQGFFGAGALLEMRCSEPYTPRRLQVEGTKAWKELGPFQYLLLTAAPGTETELVPEQDGALVVPPCPNAVIEVRCRDGQPLWSTAASNEAVAIPPPQSLAVRVVDENGAPLAGASVKQRVLRLPPWRSDGLGGVVEDRFRELAKAGADGRAVVQVPYPADPLKEQNHGDLLLFAGTAGRPPVAGGVFNRALCMDDHKVEKVPGNELVFTCKRVEPLAGCCGPVPAGTVAHLAAVCKVFMERTSYVHDARAFVTSVDAQGRFAFDDLPAELHSCRLAIVPPDTQRGSQTAVPLFPAMPGRVLPVEVASSEGAATLALVGFTSLDVQITEPAGGPARGVVAFLAPGDQRGVLFRDSLVRFPLDARGAATLRLAPGRWIVVVVSAAGWAASQFELEPGQRTVELAMKPQDVMRVQLLDRTDRGIANAQLETRGTRTRGTGDSLQSILQNLQGHTQTQWTSLRTDAEGRIVIPFVAVSGVSRKLALKWEGGSTADFALEAGTDWLVVRPQ